MLWQRLETNVEKSADGLGFRLAKNKSKGAKPNLCGVKLLVRSKGKAQKKSRACGARLLFGLSLVGDEPCACRIGINRIALVVAAKEKQALGIVVNFDLRAETDQLWSLLKGSSSKSSQSSNGFLPFKPVAGTDSEAAGEAAGACL